MSRVDVLPLETDRKPIVSIVGAGIGGLTLAILLEKQGVEYNIYERAKAIRPLGSALSLGASITPLFKQLGIYEEFLKVSKVWRKLHVFDDQRQHDYTMDFSSVKELGGVESYIISRPALYDLLLKQVPQSRLHLNKRLLTFTQNENGVMIRTSDGQMFDSDILVGADGAYSATRQGLFAELRTEKKLPVSDKEALPFTCVCLVGQTRPLDPEVYKDLKAEDSQFVNFLGRDSPFSWTTITSKQDTICWAAVQFLDKESSKSHDSFCNSEWGPEAAEEMCKHVRKFAVTVSGPEGSDPMTIGDLIDLTPKELISKVMLEEKVFDTWYSGRTVLIGDACHKVNSAGGQGAVNAIHDAVALANWISVLPSTELRDVNRIFSEYKKERFPVAKESFKTSQGFRDLGGKSLMAQLMRYLSRHVPDWLWRIVMTKLIIQRPQLSFLPRVDDHGSVKAAPQPSLDQTLKIMQERQQQQATRAL